MIKRMRLVTVTGGPPASYTIKDISSCFPKIDKLPKLGQKSVTLSGESLLKLKKRHDTESERGAKLSFAAFISESALMELERKDMLREGQFISVVGFNDSILTLKDARKSNKFFEVQIKEKKLKCITDDDLECIHVGFALALPEVRKALSR